MTGASDRVCAAWVVEIFCDGYWQRSSVLRGIYASEAAANAAIAAHNPRLVNRYRAVLGADSPPTVGDHMKYEIQFHSPTTGWERSAGHPELFDTAEDAFVAMAHDMGTASHAYRVVDAATGNELLFTAKQRMDAVRAAAAAKITDVWVPQDEIAGPDVYVVTQADGKRLTFRSWKQAQSMMDALLDGELGPLTVALVPTYIRIPRTEEP